MLVRINAQSEAYEQALTRAQGAVRAARRGAVLRAPGGARGDGAAARGGAGRRRRRGRRIWSRRSPPSSPPPGGAPTSRRPAWGRSASVGKTSPRSSGWRRRRRAERGVRRARPPPTLAGFTAELAERAAAQHVPTVEGVTLASLHAAKGLEWDAVFLVGLVDGMLPISYAVTPEAARRGAPAALRRGSPGRGGSSRCRGRRRGRRVAGRASRRGSWPGSPPDAPETLSRRRFTLARRVGPPAQVDPKLWEALRQWRSERAAEQKQPAFCVFTDATLEAIASKRPANLQQLRALPGVGATKLERFGPGVLEVLKAVGGPVPAYAHGKASAQ